MKKPFIKLTPAPDAPLAAVAANVSYLMKKLYNQAQMQAIQFNFAETWAANWFARLYFN